MADGGVAVEVPKHRKTVYLDECKKSGKAFTIEGFDYNRWEQKYRHLLDTTRTVLPNAELVLCTPFVGKSTGAHAHQGQYDIS